MGILEHDHRGRAHDRGLSAVVRWLRWAPQLWRSELNRAVLDVVAPVPAERVVDIGAGLGAGVVDAARRGAEVVGVEPSPVLRQGLQVRRWFQRARRRIAVIEGVAEALPLDDASVDAVWAVNSMQRWPDLDRAAIEIARVLRPGGRLVLVDENVDDPAHPDHRSLATRAHHDDGRGVVDVDRMGERLRAAGLEDVDTSTHVLAERPVLAVIATAAPSA